MWIVIYKKELEEWYKGWEQNLGGREWELGSGSERKMMMMMMMVGFVRSLYISFFVAHIHATCKDSDEALGRIVDDCVLCVPLLALNFILIILVVYFMFNLHYQGSVSFWFGATNFRIV